MKYREFEKRLKQKGYIQETVGGKHTHLFYHPETGKRFKVNIHKGEVPKHLEKYLD